ncbi:hypothetical protein [Labrenzia sp. OB1]|uniref:DUF7940 domain-containing protein n=1 Tax=Labrenzia sp. OB1 TaxID=1561204 RepID=UPI0007B2379C|nr:hypothetical protein [Labrenzia sp. OB1]KZM47439.1 hypothetical protein OA90_25860 [Labrenzia sp. OB1]
MTIVSDWRCVLKRAWSVRLIVFAALFSSAEVALPFLGDFISPGRMAALSALATAGAIFARILAQKDMKYGT